MVWSQFPLFDNKNIILYNGGSNETFFVVVLDKGGRHEETKLSYVGVQRDKN